MNGTECMLPLINKTSQSYGRSLMTPKDIVEYAKKNNTGVAAITDLHSMSAVPEFLLACQKAGIHGIAGVTIQVLNNKKPFGEIVLLGKGGVGFASMRDLIEDIGHISSDDKFNPNRGIELEDLLSGKYANKFANCLMLDGFPGSVGESLIKGSTCSEDDIPAIKKWVEMVGGPIDRIKKQFSEGEYLAVQTPIKKSTLAQVTSMPTIDEDFDDIPPGPVLEVSYGIAKDNRQLGQTKQWFKNYASEFLSNLGSDDEILQMINAKFDGMSLNNPRAEYRPSQEPFLGPDFLRQKCAIPSVFSDKPKSKMLRGGKEIKPIKELIIDKWPQFSMRLSEDDKKIYAAQINKELKTITSNGFDDYFMNLVKIKELAAELGNDCMLRGSAVASLVLHILELSPVDPIAEGLMFERFMDLLRVSVPDADLEFVNPSQIRQEAGKYFESGQFAYLSSDDGISKPSTLLEMSRDAMLNFFPLNDEQKDKVNQAFNFLIAPLNDPKNKRKKWAANIDDWKAEFFKTYPEDGLSVIVSELIKGASEFGSHGLKNSLSSGSMVLIPEGVKMYFNTVEVHKDKVVDDGVFRIPQSKYNIEPTGHMKYDLLPNKSFSRAMKLWRGVGLPENMALDYNDPSISFVFKQDSYLGVNQVSGFVGNDLAKRFQPKNFDELTAIYALIRDGGNKELKPMIDSYIHFKNNPDQVELHDVLKPILAETYGSLLYEEQLLKLLIQVGGYDWASADAFRSALKKGDGSVVDTYEAKFIENASEKYNVSEDVASSWYQHIRNKRGRYVFNKAHAASYAHVGVRQCYSKTRFPAHYAAELFASKGITFSGKKVDLSMIMNDWKKLHNHPAYKNNQNGMNFVDALAFVLKREEKDINSDYDRRPGQLAAKISDSIKAGDFDFVLEPGQSRENLIKYSENVFNHMMKTGYTPLDHAKPESSTSDRKSSTPSNKKNNVKSPNRDNSNQPKGESTNPNAKVEAVGVPANKRGELIKWDSEVMIGHLLDFLQKEGVVKHLDVDVTKAKALDHYRFQIEDKQGNTHNYHICAISTDPLRASFRNPEHGLNTGLHQGSNRNRSPTNTLRVAMEIVNLTGYGDIKFKFIKDKKDKQAVWLPEDKSKLFEGALSKHVRNCESPLHDTASSGILATYIPCEPTSPVMGQLDRDTYNYGMKKAKELLEDSRFISINGMREQFDNLNYSIAEVRSDKWNSFKGQSGRMLFTEVMANYQKVDPFTPIYALPTTDGVNISPGGHQRFMMDRKKGRASKMDQGFTTRRIRGHICGKTTKGAETLWLAEAAMDSLSFNELQDEIKTTATRLNINLDSAERNCVSVKNAGGGTDVISEMMGIEIVVSEKNEKMEPSAVDFFEVERKTSVEPFTGNQKVSTKSWFESKDKIHFLCENNQENVDARKKLFQLMTDIGMNESDIKTKIVTHESDASKSFNKNVNKVFDSFKNENEIFFHQSNFDTWLRGSDMACVKNGNKFEFGLATKVIEPKSKKFSEMNDAEKVEFKAKLINHFEFITGAKSLGLALDNDAAGRQDAVTIHLFAKSIGLPIGSLMPKPAPSQSIGNNISLSFKDHNDYLTSIKQCRKMGLYEQADNIIVNYSKFLKKPELSSPALSLENKEAPQQNVEPSSLRRR